MNWLTHGWDQGHWIALTVGLVAGLALVVLEFSGLAELGAVLVAMGVRWALWQIPPPGRSVAVHAPPDAWSRVFQVAVAVLLVTLGLEVLLAPAH